MTDAVSAGGAGATRSQVVCAGICALILTVGLARFSYTPLLPVMREDAGLSYLAGGWLATFNYVGYLSGALIAANMADARRRYFVYRLGLIVAVLSTAAMGWTDDVGTWALLRLVSGLSSAAGMLIASGLVLNWLMRNGYRAELGLHFTGLGLGIIVSGVAVNLMLGRLDWAQQWVALGVLGVAFLVPAWLWVPAPDPAPRAASRPAPGHSSKPASGSARRPAAGAASRSAPASAGAAAPHGPRAHAEAPPGRWMALLVGSYFCAGFGYVISATFIVAILGKMPLLTGLGGWLWVAIGLAAVPSSLLWDRVAQGIGHMRALGLGFGLQTISILLPALTEDPWLNLLSALLYGGTFIGLVSLTLALIGRRFPGNPSKAMAKLTISYGVAQIVAPAIAGMIAADTGSYRGALILAVLVMGVGMLLVAALHMLERR